MEHEILMTGIAGQGIQLASKTLALSATNEDRHVMMCPEYGGSMRGGSSLAQIAIGDGPLRALPVFHHASFALVVHDKFWAIAAARLQPGATVIVNSTLTEGELHEQGLRIVEVPATQIAGDAGSPNGGALALVAAFAVATSLVDVDSLVSAMAEQLPPYRQQHVAANEAAIRAGAAAAPRLEPAWPRQPGAAEVAAEAAS